MQIYRLRMKTSAGNLKCALNLRTCSSVSFRCLARNMETALSDPNSGISRFTQYVLGLEARR